MNHIIEEQFNKVREAYFPQWDRKREWKLSTSYADGDGELCLGSCRLSTKTIVIPEQNSTTHTSAQLRQLIIHEIAHAVANTGHGKCWRNRIEKAALRAESLKEMEIAQGLRDEIEWYSDPSNEPRVPVSVTYNLIRMFVYDNPDMSFEDFVNDFPQNWSPEEFLNRHKRSRKVYEQAKKYRAKFASREEAWAAWLEKNPEVIEDE